VRVRAIIEFDTDAVSPSQALDAQFGEDDTSDVLTDRLIDALGTPDVGVLDVVEEGESAWYRSERF
jgi:hypothetical protein